MTVLAVALGILGIACSIIIYRHLSEMKASPAWLLAACHITPTNRVYFANPYHADLRRAGASRGLIRIRSGTPHPQGQLGVQYATV
jgi:hypothetical protein